MFRMSASSVKRNVAANFTGSLWAAVMSMGFLPLYVHFIGVEAYGIVGVYLTLQSALSFFDMGMGTTLNRQLAMLSVQSNKAKEMRDTLRSFEMIYWTIALLIAAIVFLLSQPITEDWINIQHLQAQSVKQSIELMGLTIAIQFITQLYTSALMGLQQQVLCNVILACISTLRTATSLLVLWQFSPTIEAFFCCHAAANALQCFLTAAFLIRILPPSGSRTKFRPDLLRGVWRFSAGVGGTAALGLVLTQMDKIILSRLLSLEAFGYYTFATTVAMGLYRLIGPIFTAFFPRLSQVIAKDPDSLPSLYHAGCQTMAVLIIPPALMLTIYSREILLIWTRNVQLVENVFPLLSILVVGNALNGLMHLPYALQLACGKTKLSLVSNTVAVTLLAPALYVSTMRYGPIGSACVWLFLNLSYVLVVLQIMHRTLLPAEKRRWYLDDFLKPLVAGLLVAAMGTFVLRESSSTVFVIALLLVLSAATFIASALSAPLIKDQLKYYARSFTCSHHKLNPLG